MKNEERFTQTYIDIAEIKDGIVVGKNGSMKIILLCSAINFDLKTEEEQDILIAQYQNFLNSLEFPIQILIQSRKMDLKPYLDKLRAKQEKEPNELLRFQLENYIKFLQELITEVNIMDKKFYVVIPYSPPVLTTPSAIAKIAKSNPTKKLTDREFESFKKQVIQRAGVIANGLGSLGIRCLQLNTSELTELFYNIYNPDLAHAEKLIQAKEAEQNG